MGTTSFSTMSRANAIEFDEYQQIAESTDQNRRVGGSGLSFYLLGLFGETGSLLAELKKKRRDDGAYSDYRAGVLEELGDVLWYLTNASSWAGGTLTNLAKLRTEPAIPEKNKIASIEKGPRQARQSDLSSGEFEGMLIQLGGKVGGLLKEFEDGAFDSDHHLFQQRLAAVFDLLCRSAAVGGVDLHEAAALNAKKIKDRWPGQDATATPLFDEHFDVEERLPREINMSFIEKRVDGKSYVIQKCNGIKIGDRLTDNMVEDDGYRYHDVFHLSYAAVLGWSPVVRALLKCKRKSDRIMDEVQDGARAQIIEEGVSTWVFNYAVEHAFFEGVTAIEYDLLKRIRTLVKGFEVERCALWEWENAILSGFQAFRELRKNNGGLVRANLASRTLVYERS
jgi:NTP pyrophosphatase (non-canonical NTP hydrolase)